MSGIGDAHPEDPYAGRAAAFWFLFALMIVEAAAVILFYRPGDHLIPHGDLEQDAATLSGKTSDEKLKNRESGNMATRPSTPAPYDRDLERADTMDMDSPYGCATAVATPRVLNGQSRDDASVPEIQLEGATSGKDDKDKNQD